MEVTVSKTKYWIYGIADAFVLGSVTGSWGM